MPNHMHGIIELTDIDTTKYSPRAALWEIVRVFKAATSYEVRRAEGQPWFAWHEEYYDSIIRTEAALQQIREYIVNNPARWREDEWYRRY
jgi:putative transposase